MIAPKLLQTLKEFLFVVVVVVVVGKRLVYISLAIRTRWRLLVILSINTLSPFCWNSWLSLFDSWVVNYSIIRRSASKAPVNCAATPDALKEPHSYFFQSEILLLCSDKVTAALPHHSWYNTSRTSIVMYWKLGGYDPNQSEDVSDTGLVGPCMSCPL